MILPPMWKKKKITTNLQVHPLPQKKNVCSNGYIMQEIINEVKESGFNS
jgi:hypothetical protein